MSTSKQDYIAIAKIIKAERDSADTWINGNCDNDNLIIAHSRKSCTERLAVQMAWHFASQNSLFSRDRFLTACGVRS